VKPSALTGTDPLLLTTTDPLSAQMLSTRNSSCSGRTGDMGPCDGSARRQSVHPFVRLTDHPSRSVPTWGGTDRTNRRRHLGQLLGSWPRSSPVAAKRGVADAGLEVGHEPRDHQDGRPVLVRWAPPPLELSNTDAKLFGRFPLVHAMLDNLTHHICARSSAEPLSSRKADTPCLGLTAGAQRPRHSPRRRLWER